MTYVAGSQAIDATAIVTLMGTLNTHLLANGFTFVETVTNGTDIANVYKSPVANNGVMDWYLVVRRTSTTSTALRISVCEDYDSTSHLMKVYAPAPTSQVTTVPGGAVNDATGKAPSASQVATQVLTLSNSVVNAWALSVNAKRVIFSNRFTGTDTGVYAGLYDDCLPVAARINNVIVMMMAASQTSSGSLGSSTREPGGGNATASTLNFCVQFFGPYGWVSGTDLYGTRTLVDRCPIVSSRSPTNDIRGFGKDVLYGIVTGMVNGDTLAVDANGTVTTYYCMINGSNSGLWVDGAA